MSGITFSLQFWTAVVIGVAVIAAIALLAWRRRSAPVEARGPLWRAVTLIALQPVVGVLLHLTLFPPDLPLRTGALVVATAGTPQDVTIEPGEVLIALPEAGTIPRAAAAPDLATALRRRSEAARLRILGDGLTPRDQHPLSLPVVFEAPAVPRGIVDLAFPVPTAPGDRFTVGGQVGGLTAGVVELVDPVGVVVDRARVAAGARFTLASTARTPGLALFGLQLRDARGALVERIDAPVESRAQPQPRVLVLAGAPDADTKFLSRWAQEAGVDLDVRIDLGGGVQIGQGGGAITRQSLGDIDLLILDDRRWESLSPAERSALASAVEDGFGLLLRPSGPLSAATRRDWAALGAPLAGDGDSRPLRLEPRADTPNGTGDEETTVEPPELARRDLVLEDARSVSVLRDAGGVALAGWGARGRGRVGVWTVTDSYVLVLAGDPQGYGELWSRLFSALARPEDGGRVRVDGLARAGQRVTLCGLTAGLTVLDPAGGRRGLLVDPATGPEACGAYWPQRSGWHLVRGVDGRETPFYVHPADAAPSLAKAEGRRATLALAATAGQNAGGLSRGPGSPWPWFAALIAALTVLWIVERRSRRRRGEAQQSRA